MSLFTPPISSYRESKSLTLKSVLFAVGFFAFTGIAHAGADIHMLPPLPEGGVANCGTGGAEVLVWDGSHALTCAKNITASGGNLGVSGSATIAGTVKIGGAMANASTVNAANALAALLATCASGSTLTVGASGTLTCSGATASPPPPTCTPTSQQQNLGCPSGYSGSHMQQRDYTCPDGAWSGWYDISNNCTALPEPKVNAASLVCDGANATLSTVIGFYKIYLHRCADASGLGFWGHAIDTGTPASTIEYNIAHSSEALTYNQTGTYSSSIASAMCPYPNYHYRANSVWCDPN